LSTLKVAKMPSKFLALSLHATKMAQSLPSDALNVHRSTKVCYRHSRTNSFTQKRDTKSSVHV
ncbi:MAG: hypothetical protein Q9M13_02115, partial [Mariprofundales bacterium]|nr:hypothetical protein [Mariprofundales bacterium]